MKVRLASMKCRERAPLSFDRGGYLISDIGYQISEFYNCPGRESNPPHEDFQSSALPTELPGHSAIAEWDKLPTKKPVVKAAL